MDGKAINDPAKDPYTFIKAEDFFNLDGFVTPVTATLEREVVPNPNRDAKIVTSTGAMFKLEAGHDKAPVYLLIQFVRAQVFRLRLDPSVTNEGGNQYQDFNSRTIIAHTLTELVSTLDALEGCFWKVKLDEITIKDKEDPDSTGSHAILTPAGKGTHYRLRSFVYETQDELNNDKNGVIELCILIQRANFHIKVLRRLFDTAAVVNNYADLVEGGEYFDANAKPSVAPEKKYRVVWETVDNPVRWRQFVDTHATILTVKKPGSAKYIGFGEQGGQHLLKKSTFMNYFNYDNMQYQGVYGKGPLDEREPLYHSEPFWIELNTHQHTKSKVATFIDNLSQICIDFGATNGGRISTATRFGAMQYYVIAADDIPDVIRLYTSIIGRPNLKPRYVLGFHQSCYGYDTKWKVMDAVHGYRNRGFPLDGMHIDVDLQDNYKTFTMDSGPGGKFPDPKGMFTDLRALGVKCSTNITPVISTDSTNYPIVTDGLEKQVFVMDQRKRDCFFDKDRGGVQGWSVDSADVRYMVYNKGSRDGKDPHNGAPFRDPERDRLLREGKNIFDLTYDSKDKPFRGGVYYGQDYGTPGYYPNLNNYKVREWWGQQYKDLFDAGLEFVWQDMTSPCMADAWGDMKSFPFRLLLESDAWRGQETSLIPAIEVWHLYSYNLHKATYHGLNKLKGREGKRNFIIGRGSYAGMHRYAGLWTGDNGSTWDHFRISVSQVLAAGLSGVTITGADVGGFEEGFEGQQWADPELIIRWFCAYFMLPWFRCHYMGKPGKKQFQEPYRYTDKFNNRGASDAPPADEYYLYKSVEPICRYYIKLRYTLLQLLYDTMFDNLFTGLPIARALVVSDTLDEALFTDFQSFLSDEYVIGNDLLIAPIMTPQSDDQGHTQNWFENGQWHKPYRTHGERDVYLPQHYSWYPFNLRVNFDPNTNPGAKLSTACDGGSTIRWGGNIGPQTTNDDEDNPGSLQYVTAMYVREGGIIPQIGARTHVPGKDEQDVNPITVHVYPGRSNKYYLYLDDGESRDSAPDTALSEYCRAESQKSRFEDGKKSRFLAGDGSGDAEDVDGGPDDLEALNNYRAIQVSQHWVNTPQPTPSGGVLRTGHRTVTLTANEADLKDSTNGRPQGTYPWDKAKARVGEHLYVVLWHAEDVDMETVEVKVGEGWGEKVVVRQDKGRRATVVTVPVELEVGVVVECAWRYY